VSEYRVRLSLLGPIATPLHSGTLFGHLCWAKRYRDGEATLRRWLEDLPQRPLLISDAFPADHLPRPLLPPTPYPEATVAESWEALRQRLERDQRLRETAWIRVANFLELRTELSEARLLQRLAAQEEAAETSAATSGCRGTSPARIARVRQGHRSLNRLCGDSMDTVYFTDEDWHCGRAREWDVYVAGDIGADELRELFEQVGEFGFGRDASLGRGQFSVELETADAGLFGYPGQRFLSLSHGVISPNMVDPLYRLHTHYGKLAGSAVSEAFRPFKYPLLLTRAGATFSATDSGPFGALLAGVHPQQPEIRHNAWHLCLPFSAA
jgi:CRISPR-associated protein Csm4